MSLESKIEALLFTTDQPLSTARLLEVLPGTNRDEIAAAMETLGERYEDVERAFHIVRIAGGFQLLTKEEHGPLVRQLFRGKRRVRLTKAALETLAIISYKQPTTRPEIDAIRGVSSGGVLETLMERDLARIAGRAEGVGRPLLYATTPTFLQYLGLNNLKDLPSLSEIEAMIAEREEADRDAEEAELLELAEQANPEAEDTAERPAATLEERLREQQLPSLEEIDDELREHGAQIGDVSSRLESQQQADETWNTSGIDKTDPVDIQHQIASEDVAAQEVATPEMAARESGAADHATTEELKTPAESGPA